MACGRAEMGDPWTFSPAQTVREVVKASAVALGEELQLTEVHVQS